MRKITCMLLLVAMMLGMVGGASVAETDTSYRIVPVGETLELNIWQAFEAAKGITLSSFNDIISWQYIEELTGIKVNFKHPAVGSEAEAFNLMLATGDLPDIVFYNWTGVPGGPLKAIDDGLILPLNDLIDEYCPNFSEAMATNPAMRSMISTDDGIIYGFPSWCQDDRDPTEEGYIPAFQTFGWLIRRDWMNAVGIEKLPETMDEWETTLTAIKDGDPKGDGSPVIPIVASGNNPTEIQNWIRAWGITNDFYISDPAAQTVGYGFYTPEYKEAVTTLARWYANGLIDPDFATSNGTNKDSLITGNVAAAWTGSTSGGFGRYITMMKPINPDVDATGTIPPRIEGGEAYKFDAWSKYPLGRQATISATSKYPVEAAMFCDFFYSYVGHMFMNWGVEGESYIINPDGTPAFTDLVRANPDGLSVDQALIRYALAADDFFFYMDPQLWLARMWLPEQREMLPRWATGSRDRIIPNVLPTSDEADEFAGIMAEVRTYAYEMFNKFVMGLEPLENFDGYMKIMQQMGVERAIELKQAQLDRFNAR